MARQTNKKKDVFRYVNTGHEKFSDVDIRLTSKEMEILASEPSELLKLYLFINARRDFKTNIAGQVTRISDSAFKQHLGYTGKPGRTAWRPTTTHITRWLEQLETLGLIKRLGNHVFHLPLAYTEALEKNQSHHNVTTFVTHNVTKQDNAETSINKEENTTTESDLSPPLSPPLSNQLYTPLNNNLTKLNYTELPNFLSTAENKFLNLFTDLKLNVKPAGDLKAITAAKALLQAGVSLEVASEALKIKLAGYQGDRTPHPSYFTQAIIDYKRELDAIKQQPQETKHERATTLQHTATNSRRDRYKKILR